MTAVEDSGSLIVADANKQWSIPGKDWDKEARHLRRGAGLFDEDQALRVEIEVAM